jgi:hypothetical protein
VAGYGSSLEGHRQFMAWIEEVKSFLRHEPEFDSSHLARFEALQINALLEFIKEFTD